MMLALPAGASADQDSAARLAELTHGFDVREELYQPAGQPAVSLRFLLNPDTADRSQRLGDATRSALRRFADWFGPFPHAQLTVIDAPWSSGLAGVSYPGVVVTTTRWIRSANDRTLERFLIAAIGRQYWIADARVDSKHTSFVEGLMLYSGVRGIHEELEGRHFETRRLFGGFVPFTIPALLWSPSPTDPRPRLRRFEEVDRPASAPWREWMAVAGRETQRVALALHTLERYIGWPAMQQALEALQRQWRPAGGGPENLSAIASRQRGHDMTWFFAEALRFDARFDYGITAFTSEPLAGQPGFQTHLELGRLGDGVFAATNEPGVGPFKSGRSLPVLVRFEDGTEVREWWAAREVQFELNYVGPARAVMASVDPDAMVLLDEDRANNSRVLRADTSEAGARLASGWIVWLQNMMLTCTGLL